MTVTTNMFYGEFGGQYVPKQVKDALTEVQLPMSVTAKIRTF